MRWIVVLAAVLLFASVASAGDYEDAVRRAQQEDKPLVVVVCADWCGPCQRLKLEVIEPMKRERDIVVAVVNYDQNNKLARYVMAGTTSLPYVAAYKFKGKWMKAYASGYQSRRQILELIQRAKE